MCCKVVKYNPRFVNETLSGVNILTVLELKFKPWYALIAELKLDWRKSYFLSSIYGNTFSLTNNNNLFCSITLRSLQIDLNKTSTVKKRYNKQVFSYLLWNILEKQRKYFCIFECKILLSWRNRKRFFTTFLLLSLDRQSSYASYLDGFFGETALFWWYRL